MEIRNYIDAFVELAGKNKLVLSGRKTALVKNSDNSISVNYRGTDVVKYSSDNVITLNSGGFKTRTTRKVMNNYLPVGLKVVETDNEIWVLKGSNGKWSYYTDMTTINLNTGEVKGESLDYNLVEEQIELGKQVKNYVTRYMEAVRTDSLYKQTNSYDFSDANVPFVENRAKSYVKSSVYSPSLLSRSIVQENPDPIYLTMARDCENWAMLLWNIHDTKALEQFYNVAERSLTRFLRKSLNLAV